LLLAEATQEQGDCEYLWCADKFVHMVLVWVFPKMTLVITVKKNSIWFWERVSISGYLQETSCQCRKSSANCYEVSNVKNKVKASFYLL